MGCLICAGIPALEQRLLASLREEAEAEMGEGFARATGWPGRGPSVELRPRVRSEATDVFSAGRGSTGKAWVRRGQLA